MTLVVAWSTTSTSAVWNASHQGAAYHRPSVSNGKSAISGRRLGTIRPSNLTGILDRAVGGYCMAAFETRRWLSARLGWVDRRPSAFPACRYQIGPANDGREDACNGSDNLSEAFQRAQFCPGVWQALTDRCEGVPGGPGGACVVRRSMTPRRSPKHR